MGMKNKFMATAAVVAILAATGAARADEISQIKAQSIALKKQNAALEARLNKLEKQQAKQEKKIDAKVAAAPAGAPAESFMGMVTKGPLEVITDEGPLCWHGICAFGTIDAGVSYAQHGLPINDKLYLGDQVLNSKARGSYFGISPSNMSYSVLGIKGETEILPGLSGVFWASTNVNPQSGQLANAPGSVVEQNGQSVFNYSNNGDGSRGGQAFNDQLYVGLSSPTWGLLTAGRNRSLATDLVGAYDATGGAAAFSLMGYSGTYVSGQAYTDNGRWDDSLKYKVSYGPARFAAMYKFRDGNGGSNNAGGILPTKNDAGQIGGGLSYMGLDVDGLVGYYHQASTVSALSAAQLTASQSSYTNNVFGSAAVLGPVGSLSSANLAATSVADATGGAIGAKYTWNQFKFFAGWSHIILHNPANPVGVGANNDQGGYVLNVVANNAYFRAKLLDTEWVGVKYAYDAKTDIIAEYEHVNQNGYGSAAALTTCGLATINPATGSATGLRSSSCSGSIDSGSLVVDYHFTKRFDIYGGVFFEHLNGGLASAYFYTSQFSPTVGARFTF
jgi:predicted porin